jgi:hypothetical protein
VASFLWFLPRPVANVQNHNFIGHLLNFIENQKWISHYRHQSYTFLIGEVAKKRYFPDQRGHSLDLIDDRHSRTAIALKSVCKYLVELAKRGLGVPNLHAR